ncbi:MAG: YlbF family regulator [Oscillospiraceae bacterium]|nr:YlbF family regulator [Oscillospiraceae bacterium]
MNENIISMAREIGKLIQEEECYKNLEKARIASDADQELQGLIGEFNLKRIAINEEGMKKDRDQEKIQEFNNQMREIYADIMKNENMLAYNDAKTELDKLVGRIAAIVTNCANGEDPETTDVHEGCSGDCSGCSSCG